MNKFARPMLLAFSFIAVVVGLSVVFAPKTHALGPALVDATDYSGFGGQPVYLSSTDSGSVSTDDIGGAAQQVGIYFTTRPAANFTITIQQADLCRYHSDRNPVAPSVNIIDYGWDRGDDPTAGSNVTQYSFKNFSTGVIQTSIWGVVNASTTTCASKTMTINPNWLVFDNNTRKWAGYITFNGVPRTSIGQAAGSSGYTNSFRLVAPAGAILSYEGNKYFAVDAGGKMVNTGNIRLRFAVDCSVMPEGTVTSQVLRLKDPDNGSATTQPTLFYFRLQDDTTGAVLSYASGSTAGNRISGYSGMGSVTGGTNFYPSGGSGTNAIIRANLISGHRYSWIMYGVYDNNTIQFQMPFDSIYYTTGCQPQAEINPNVRIINADTGAAIASGSSVPFGTRVQFINSVALTNLVNVGSDTYTWEVTSSSPAGVLPGDVPVTSRLLSAAAPSTTSPVITVNAVGNFCKQTAVTRPAPTINYATLIAPNPEVACVTGAAPPTPPTITLSPADYEKGLGGTVTMNVSIGCGSTSGSVGWSVTSPISGVLSTNPTTGTVTCVANTSQPATVTITGSNLDDNVVGNINMTPRITSPSVVTGSDAALNIYEVPYTRFYGNDIYSTSNTMVRFNTNTATAGSGSQYAVIARAILANIRLNSATFRTTTPTPPAGLKAQWASGGSTPDPTAVLTELPTATGAVVNWAADGYYNYGASNVSLNRTGVTKKVTIKARSIYITADGSGNGITTNVPGGAFVDATTPVVLLIADGGNIYIDKDVRRIDAILVATTGTIYTCAATTPSWQEVPRTSWHTAAGCTKSLTINGALNAPTIRFARSVGTRMLAPANEDSGSAGAKTPMNIRPSNTSPTSQAAEVINYPAYLYFANPYLQDKAEKGYQSLLSAPPRL